nr:hypothetical protein [uncultured Sphingomonas sp.]
MSVPTQIFVTRQTALPAADEPIWFTRWDDADSVYSPTIKQGVRNAFDAGYRDYSEMTQIAVDDAAVLADGLPRAYAYLHPALGMGLSADATPVPTRGSESAKLAYVHSLAAPKLRIDQATETLRPSRELVGKRPVMTFPTTGMPESAALYGSLPLIDSVYQGFDIFVNVNFTAALDTSLLALLNNSSTGTNAQFVQLCIDSNARPYLLIRNPPTGAAVTTTLVSATALPLPSGWGTLHARVNFLAEAVGGVPANSAALYWIAADGVVTELVKPTALTSPAGAVSAGSLRLRLGGNGGSRRIRGQVAQTLIRGDLTRAFAARAGMTATLPRAI